MANNFKNLNGKTPPSLPKWLFILQIVVIVLSFGFFVASCYALTIFGGGPPAFLLFDALLIWIVVGGFLVLERFFANLYFRIAFIISYSVLIVFLLAAWAWAADATGFYIGGCGVLGCIGSAGAYERYGRALAAGAALAAFTWVLVIVILVFYIIAALKDDDGTTGTAAAPFQPDAEMGTVKHETGPTTVAPHHEQPDQQQPYGGPQESYYPPAQAEQSPYVADQSGQQYPPQQPYSGSEQYPQQYPPQQQQQQQPPQQH